MFNKFHKKYFTIFIHATQNKSILQKKLFISLAKKFKLENS